MERRSLKNLYLELYRMTLDKNSIVGEFTRSENGGLV